MNLTKDQFDTDIFGLDVYKLTIEPNCKLDEIDRALKNIKKGIIVTFVPANSENISLLERLKFNFINIRAKYKLLENNQLNKIIPSGIKISKYTAEAINEEAINKLANCISRETRYGKDDKINRNLRIKLYNRWIKNCLNGKYSQGVFIAWDKNEPIGICSTKVKEDCSEIDLLGVLPMYRGKKIGAALVTNAVSYLKSIQNKPLFVVTSGENVAACKLFERSGFLIDQVELVYHLHIEA